MFSRFFLSTLFFTSISSNPDLNSNETTSNDQNDSNAVFPIQSQENTNNFSNVTDLNAFNPYQNASIQVVKVPEQEKVGDMTIINIEAEAPVDPGFAATPPVDEKNDNKPEESEELMEDSIQTETQGQPILPDEGMKENILSNANSELVKEKDASINLAHSSKAENKFTTADIDEFLKTIKSKDTMLEILSGYKNQANYEDLKLYVAAHFAHIEHSEEPKAPPAMVDEHNEAEIQQHLADMKPADPLPTEKVSTDQDEQRGQQMEKEDEEQPYFEGYDDANNQFGDGDDTILQSNLGGGNLYEQEEEDEREQASDIDYSIPNDELPDPSTKAARSKDGMGALTGSKLAVILFAVVAFLAINRRALAGIFIKKSNQRPDRSRNESLFGAVSGSRCAQSLFGTDSGPPKGTYVKLQVENQSSDNDGWENSDDDTGWEKW